MTTRRNALLTTVLLTSLFTATIIVWTRAEPALLQASIQGAWRVTEIRDAAGVNSQPQPELYIFTKRHYSIIQIVGREPRKAPADLQTASAAELLAVYGPNFAAQSGTYTATSTTLTARPIVAKQPAQMAPGNVRTFALELRGDELTLAISGATYRLTRVE